MEYIPHTHTQREREKCKRAETERRKPTEGRRERKRAREGVGEWGYDEKETEVAQIHRKRARETITTVTPAHPWASVGVCGCLMARAQVRIGRNGAHVHAYKHRFAHHRERTRGTKREESAPVHQTTETQTLKKKKREDANIVYQCALTNVYDVEACIRACRCLSTPQLAIASMIKNPTESPYTDPSLSHLPVRPRYCMLFVRVARICERLCRRAVSAARCIHR